MAVSFDCFGTLVTADRPGEPWDAVAAALRERGVSVPDDWEAAYRSSHREYDRGAEAPLDEHVRLALASRGVAVSQATAREATLSAFDRPVTVREGAREAVAAAGDCGPVAVCSNCSVPGLVDRALERAGLVADGTDRAANDTDRAADGTDLTADRVDLAIDRVVTSVDCGWRKPDRRVFDAVADALGIPFADLVHVGDDARTDGGAGRAGATTVLVEDVPLADLPRWLDREGRSC